MSELRRDPVSGAWVVIAPQQESGVKLERSHRPETPRVECPFCPGQGEGWGPEILVIPSIGGKSESSGSSTWGVRVVPNRVPVLRTDEVFDRKSEGIHDRMTGVGAHEIVVETPEHSLDLKDFPVDQLSWVLKAWRERVVDLFRDIRLKYVSIVKNQGRRAGARLTHPHSQIVATPTIPSGIRNELESARRYFDTRERNLFVDLLDRERKEETRIVTETEGFVALCPFASKDPFEVWILPTKRACHFESTRDDEIAELANVLSEVSQAIALSLFDPDVNVILKTGPNPNSGKRRWLTLEEDFVWRIEVIPRIVRPSGYENATGMRINPTPPEDAAASLRDSLRRIGEKGADA